MSVRELVARLIAAGIDPVDAAQVVAEAVLIGASGAHVDQAAERRRAKDRERKRLRNSAESAEEQASNIRPNSAEIPQNSAESRARVRDITSTSVDTGILSLTLVREWSGDALADMARAPGIASLHPLKAAMRGKNPCSLEDIEAGVRSAAAWMLGKRGPGRMQSWDLAVKMAGEARDRRVAGAPEPADVIPLRPGTGPPRQTFAAQIAEENQQARDMLMKMLENGSNG